MNELRSLLFQLRASLPVLEQVLATLENSVRGNFPPDMKLIERLRRMITNLTNASHRMDLVVDLVDRLEKLDPAHLMNGSKGAGHD